MATGYGRIEITSVTPVNNIQSSHQYDVTARFDIKIAPYGKNELNQANYSITINGSNSGSRTCNFNSRDSWVTLGSYTARVTMDKSGLEKTIEISAYVDTHVNPSSISANTTCKLPAVTWQWLVSYDDNGGSGAPFAQAKTYGSNLTLSSTIPTRTNYNFKGWSVNRNASVPEYYAGGTYTANSSITLYAVWELAYWKPKITNVFVNRCNSDGTNNEEGQNARVSFRWECCQLVGTNNVASIMVGGKAVSASGTSGNASVIIGGGYSVEETYSFGIVVTDSKGGTSRYDTYVDSTHFAIDFKAGGTGVAIGMPAKDDNTFAVNFPSQFYKPINAEGGVVSEEGILSGHEIDGDIITAHSDIFIGDSSLIDRFGGLALGTPVNLGGDFNRPTGASPYYRCIQLDWGSTQASDRYFLLIDANGKLFTGRALNGAKSITWVEK